MLITAASTSQCQCNQAHKGGAHRSGLLRSQHCRSLSMLHYVACCIMLHVVRCMLYMLHVLCCMLCVACCVLHVVRCMLDVGCSTCCMFCVACCTLHVVRCMLCVACSTLHVACCAAHLRLHVGKRCHLAHKTSRRGARASGGIARAFLSALTAIVSTVAITQRHVLNAKNGWHCQWRLLQRWRRRCWQRPLPRGERDRELIDALGMLTDQLLELRHPLLQRLRAQC